MTADIPIASLRRVTECDDGPETCGRYGGDATGLFFRPQAVAFPRTTAEVADIMALANEFRFPVVPRGAGTGKSGGAVPVAGGLALSVEHLTRLSIDTRNLIATVEPGVVLIDLHRAAENLGLFYPPDPSSLDRCTLGGNIAENAGGPRCLKYGVTRDYVLGLTVVLGDGRVMKTGAATIKSVAGYGLTHLIVGSEGTLAIVTEATLKLLPKPAVIRTLVLTFPDTEHAVAALTQTLQSGIFPASLELVDAVADRLTRHYLVDRPDRLAVMQPATGDAVHLLVDVDGGIAETEEAVASIMRIAGTRNVQQVFVAGTREEQDSIWHFRRSISLALSRAAPNKISEDVVVPRSRLAEALQQFRAIGRQFGFESVIYGHAGDGNLHVNLLVDSRAGETYRKAEEASAELMRAALAMGGSISGEHGIGLTKARFLPWEVGEVGMDVMRRIKQVFDPNNVLNPYKIFPR